MANLQDILNAFAAQIQLVGGGGGAPGSLITAALSPDPLQTGLVGGPNGLTRTTVLLKMLRFGDASLPDSGTSIADFLTIAGQVLGGQAMPAMSVNLPGPALPGARIPVTTLAGGTSGLNVNPLNGLVISEDVPAGATLPDQPSLGPDPGADLTHDVLSGVPGIVGVIETGLTQPLPLQLSLTWTFTVAGGPPGVTVPGPLTTAPMSLSSLSLVPPVIFMDLGVSPPFTLSITATGTLSVAGVNPAVSVPLNLGPVSVPFPGIPIPRLLALFTWPLYGSQPAAGRSDPEQDSVLIMLPADSPLNDKSSITSAISSTQGAIGPVLSLVSGGLAAGTLAPFALPTTTVTQLTAVLAGLTAPGDLLSAAASGGYTPLSIAKASGSGHGELSDITNLWWHAYFPGGHDYYHDNAQSFLWMGPPASSVTIFRDTQLSFSSTDRDHGKMTLTTGDTCLVGIVDFRPAPDTSDPTLAPTAGGLLHQVPPSRTGFFTREHPPTSEGDWAWTDSFQFL